MEFSFFVLADAGAFVTRGPARITPNDLVFRDGREREREREQP